MPQSVTLRIMVENPLPAVDLRVQRGRDALIAPVSATATALAFDLQLDVQTRADGELALKGSELQGPAAARFIYVNAGRYAGQPESPWGTRAKIPLKELSSQLIRDVLNRSEAVIACTISGRARNGGPAAATVPLLKDGWTIVKR